MSIWYYQTRENNYKTYFLGIMAQHEEEKLPKTPSEIKEMYLQGRSAEVKEENRAFREYEKTYEGFTLNKRELETVSDEIRISPKSTAELVKTHNRLRLNNNIASLLTDRLTALEGTLNYHKKMRARNSERNLLFLPQLGDQTWYNINQFMRIPKVEKDGYTFFEVWQYISEFATTYGLSEETTIRCLAEKVTEPMRIDIMNKFQKEVALPIIIERIQNRYGKFPTPEEWEKAFNTFERRKGESITTMVTRWIEIGIRRYHDLEDHMAMREINKRIWDSFDEMICEQTRVYIKTTINRIRGNLEGRSPIACRIGLAKIYEEEVVNRRQPYQGGGPKSTVISRSQLVGRLDEIIQRITHPYNTRGVKKAIHIALQDQGNRTPCAISRRTSKNGETLCVRFLNYSTIISRSDVPSMPIAETTPMRDAIQHNLDRLIQLRLKTMDQPKLTGQSSSTRGVGGPLYKAEGKKYPHQF